MYFPKGEITTKREKNKIKTEVFSFSYCLPQPIVCFMHPLRGKYMGFVLQVHGLCTASTWPLYCKYMGFVLRATLPSVDVDRLQQRQRKGK